MLLRKHLNNARVADVFALPDERVLNIRFENFNELGNRVLLVLSLELMGKHSNMIFYDDIQQNILGVAHAVNERMSQFRELTAGLPYAAPPHPEGKLPLSALTRQEVAKRLEPEKFADWPQILNQKIEGVGLLLAEDIAAQSPDALACARLLDDLYRGENLKPALSTDTKRFSLAPPPPPENWIAAASVLEMTRDYFTQQLVTQRLNTIRQSLKNALSARQKKLNKQLQELKPVSEADIHALQHCGDLILTAHTSGLLPAKPHSGIAEVPDFDNSQPPKKLDVDPALDWPGNAQLYYRRAKKARARQAAYETQREQFEHQQDYLSQLQSMILNADTLPDLLALSDELVAEGLLKSTAVLGGDAKDKKFAGLSSFVSTDGFTIHVGKTGTANANIVGKIAKPDDLWLHIQDMPGSHVLIKTDKKSIPNQTLLEAATLAVYYSSARDSKNVPVLYTQARHVRKIPESYPGHVTYKQEQAVFITADPALIASLQPLKPNHAQREEESHPV